MLLPLYRTCRLLCTALLDSGFALLCILVARPAQLDYVRISATVHIALLSDSKSSAEALKTEYRLSTTDDITLHRRTYTKKDRSGRIQRGTDYDRPPLPLDALARPRPPPDSLPHQQRQAQHTQCLSASVPQCLRAPHAGLVVALRNSYRLHPPAVPSEARRNQDTHCKFPARSLDAHCDAREPRTSCCPVPASADSDETGHSRAAYSQHPAPSPFLTTRPAHAYSSRRERPGSFFLCLQTRPRPAVASRELPSAPVPQCPAARPVRPHQ